MNRKQATVAIAALTALCVALGAWAVTAQLRASRLSREILALQAEPAESAAIQAALPDDPDAVAAEFNGGIVTAGEAAQEYAVISAYYQMLGMSEEEYEEDAKLTVLDSLVETKVLEMKAREAGVYELSDEERAGLEARVREEYEDNIRYYMEFRFDESKTEDEVREETVEYLEANGYSYEEMLENAIESAWKDRLFDYVTASTQISEEQMRAFYQQQLESAELTYSADFSVYESDAEAGRTMVWNPEGVRCVDTIFISFDESRSADYLAAQAAAESGALDALYAELEPEAQSVLDRLSAGESFEALQAEFGTLSAHGSYVSERSTLWGDDFREAALSLAEIGALSAPTRVEGGLCILRYSADVPAGAVAFEDVREALQSTYEAELKSSQYNAAVVQWIQEADATYYPERF